VQKSEHVTRAAAIARARAATQRRKAATSWRRGGEVAAALAARRDENAPAQRFHPTPCAGHVALPAMSQAEAPLDAHSAGGRGEAGAHGRDQRAAHA